MRNGGSYISSGRYNKLFINQLKSKIHLQDPILKGSNRGSSDSCYSDLPVKLRDLVNSDNLKNILNYEKANRICAPDSTYFTDIGILS
jgi:hypothetical protein